MIAYVVVAPVASAFAERVPRRAMLVALDLVRAGVALLLPFVTEIWQVYVLIFALQSASAILGLIAGGAAALAAFLWPATGHDAIEHSHDGLPANHPHWTEGASQSRNRHAHAYVIDDLHTSWPQAR